MPRKVKVHDPFVNTVFMAKSVGEFGIRLIGIVLDKDLCVKHVFELHQQQESLFTAHADHQLCGLVD